MKPIIIGKIYGKVKFDPINYGVITINSMKENTMFYIKFEITPIPNPDTRAGMVLKVPVYPIDMFRYDGCYPANPKAIDQLIQLQSRTIKVDTDVRIKLISGVPNKDWEPTYKRWESFGWNAKIVSTTAA